MKFLYKSKNYDDVPQHRKKRYVRYRTFTDVWSFCEVDQDDSKFDIAQGIVEDPSIIPAAIRDKAVERSMQTYNYIEFPYS